MHAEKNDEFSGFIRVTIYTGYDCTGTVMCRQSLTTPSGSIFMPETIDAAVGEK